MEAHGGVAPAARDLGLHARHERRVGDAQRDADDGAPGQVGPGRLREQGEQGRVGADRVVELEIAFERGGEDGDTGLALKQIEDLLGQAVGQGPGLQDVVVTAGQGGAGVEHGVVEVQTGAAQGRAQRGHRAPGVGHEEVAGVAPSRHGLQVGPGDGRVEQDRAVDVGGQELAHRPSLRVRPGSGGVAGSISAKGRGPCAPSRPTGCSGRGAAQAFRPAGRCARARRSRRRRRRPTACASRRAGTASRPRPPSARWAAWSA